MLSWKVTLFDFFQNIVLFSNFSFVIASSHMHCVLTLHAAGSRFLVGNNMATDRDCIVETINTYGWVN